MGVKLHPHHHTSYPVLALLLLITGFTLASVSLGTSAGTLSESGSVSLSGVMPGPPPAIAPTITSPSSGQRFTKLPVTLSGTCSNGLRVVLLRNNQVAGQVYCSSSGSFEVLIDLIPGQNELIARQFDALDQSSPNSVAVILFYDKPETSIIPPGTNSTLPTSPSPQKPLNPTLQSPPFLIWSTFSGKNIFPDNEFKLFFELSGGIAPYAVHIEWGDGRSSLISVSKAGSVQAPHTYAGPGVYKIVLKTTDANGSAAYFQTGLTVNGKTVTPPATISPDRQLVILWPIFIIVAALVAGFWLGDRYEYGRWRNREEKTAGAL